jgi:hypothetical protein
MYYETCSVCPQPEKPMRLWLIVWHGGYMGIARVVRAATKEGATILARMPEECPGVVVTCQEVSTVGESGIVAELEWDG